jgi:hypothetical protein
MATYGIQPMNYVSENMFSPISTWNIVNGSSAQIHFQLLITDALGTRRYCPPQGTSVNLSFTRSRAPSIGSKATLIQKLAVQILPGSDRSFFQVDLTSSDTSAIITGGVQLKLVIPVVGEVSFSLPHLIRKSVSAPGF